MAKSKALSKIEKKALRAKKRQAAREQRGQMWQAFNMQRKQDKLLLPLMIGAILGLTLLFFLIGLIWGGQWFMLPAGLLFGILAAMIIFSRRIQKSVYTKAEGQPGAAAWALDQLRGTWRVAPAIAANTHFDAVHRVVGRPGVVLVGEGVSHRVAPMLNQEKKKLTRVVGDTPIYQVSVGTGDDQIPLSKLNTHLAKLPNNIDGKKVDALDSRLTAIGARTGVQAQMPKGPVPAGAKARNVNRAARRRGK